MRMSKLGVPGILAAFMLAQPALPMVLDCGVEKTDVEGRIGIRINCAGIINKVHPGSPAEEAGLRRNDIVTTVDGRKHNVDNISGEPGTTVHLVVRRGFKKFEVDVERRDMRLIQHHTI